MKGAALRAAPGTRPHLLWYALIAWFISVSASASLAADPEAASDFPPTRAQLSAAADEAAEEEAYATGIEAYLYGYPRVELARRKYNETHRVKSDQVIFAPVNRFYYFDRLGRPGDGRVIKAPNNDTLYASSYLDLLNGPVVLQVPNVGERHYVALIVDAAGGVKNRLSRSVYGPGGDAYLFAGPSYNGPTPAGMKRIQAETNDLWMLMRLASDGTSNDQSIAAGLLRAFTLEPLASYSPDNPKISENADLSGQPLVEPLEPFSKLSFFKVLDDMLMRNPVPLDDGGLVEHWQRLGVGRGTFDPESLSKPVKRGLERAIVSAEKIVAAAQFGIANNINGWNYSDKIGRIRSDWALNAAIAKGGYGNRVEDSVYHQRNVDDSGTPLSGKNRYRVTFDADALPPVRAFWSLTAYDQDKFDLIENSIQRYSIGDRTPGLTPNPDGSLTIAIQNDEPSDPVLRANWLPIGPEQFYLIMRSYDPEPEIASGKWAPPPVQRIE